MIQILRLLQTCAINTTYKSNDISLYSSTHSGRLGTHHFSSNTNGKENLYIAHPSAPQGSGIPPEPSPGSKVAQTADLNYQRTKFDELGKELGIKHLEDWYRIRYAQVRAKIGSGIMKRYDDSMIYALKAIYPEHEWLDWHFSSAPRHYWKNPANVRKFFEYVGSKSLGITNFRDPVEMEKWYNVSMADFNQHKGRSVLLKIAAGSPSGALAVVFPEHTWSVIKFKNLPRDFTSSKDGQQSILLSVAKKLGIKRKTGWYKVTVDQFQHAGGSGLLARYGRSVRKVVMNVYPDHPWEAWRFSNALSRVLASKDPVAVKQYMDHLGQQLGVSDLESWYRVSKVQLISQKAFSLISKHGLLRLLQIAYPEKDWKQTKFALVSKRATQRVLRNAVTTIFPNQKVIEEYSSPQLISTSGSNPKPLQLDLYLPDLKLAFEFQGDHHFDDYFKVGGSSTMQDRDSEKKAICVRAGISLVEIPPDWEGSISSVLSEISSQVPLMLKNSSAYNADD